MFGTVVDQDIIPRAEGDIYLVCHDGIQGTSILSRLYQFPTKHSGAVFYRPVPLDWWGL